MKAKRVIVIVLERSCAVVDRLPAWTYPLVGSWLGCPHGLGRWSCELDEKWRTDVWKEPAA